MAKSNAGRKVKDWIDLTEGYQFKLYLQKSHRVPSDYKPPSQIPISGTKYPEAIVVDLSTAHLSLTEEQLWALLRQSWQSLNIEPQSVHFRLNGKTVLKQKVVF